MAAQQLACPFCPFEDADEYFLRLHIEELHTDNSPFAIKHQEPDTSDDLQLPRACIALDNDHGGDDQIERYVECPEDECGESILLSDLNEHLDFHLAEQVGLDEEQPNTSSSLSPFPTDGRMHSSTDDSSEYYDEQFTTAIHPKLRREASKAKTPRKSLPSTPSTSSVRRHHERVQREAHKDSLQKEPGRLGVRSSAYDRQAVLTLFRGRT